MSTKKRHDLFCHLPLTFFDIYVFIWKNRINFAEFFQKLSVLHIKYITDTGRFPQEEREEYKVIRHYFHISALTAAILLLVPSGGCNRQSRNEAITDSDSVATAPAEYYHADNDIAMTVRSLVDALSIGERLDSANYDFKGVLTDGQGRPLYTDITGTPGIWEVDVTSPTSAVIRNTNIGDLLPWDLEHYLVQTLNLDESDMIPPSPEVPADADIHRVEYDFGSGYLRIETRKVIADGMEGALMNITTAKKPDGAESRAISRPV